MLTWMESHPLPFVCTTNLVERLDPATQRRFTFRIRFDWLREDQLPLAWSTHFAAPLHADVVAIDRLAPGDFANVARRMRALGQDDPSAILGELRHESEAKEGKARPIGFGPLTARPFARKVCGERPEAECATHARKTFSN